MVHLFYRPPFFQSTSSGILACVAVFYISGHTSLSSNVFQIKTAKEHSVLCRVFEMEVFAKMVNNLKMLTIFAKSSVFDVLNASLN